MTGLFDTFTWVGPFIPTVFLVCLWLILYPSFSRFSLSISETLLPGLPKWGAGAVSIFATLVGINFIGFLGFTFPLTTQVAATLSLAAGVWGGTVLYGIFRWRFLFFAPFFPSGAPLLLAPLLVPVEIASFLARPVSLGLRLAANLTAGHLLLHILGGSLHVILFVSIPGVAIGLLGLFFVIGLELGVLFIQAFVFALLSGIYLRDVLELH